MNANHNQDNISGLVNINAPSIGFTAVTIYPFTPKDFVGVPKWYQKLGIGLASQVSGLTNFYDSLFSFHHLIDTFRFGAQNNVPISLALPQLGFCKYPGSEFPKQILNTKYDYNWISLQKVDTSSQKGVYIANLWLFHWA